MATVITEECINCGACEPECPNTAIYAGGIAYESGGATFKALSEDFFYIVPEKCSECVGFLDHEACAAACPVDCCIPDPKCPEEEEALLARARALHPERHFDDPPPSRFRKARPTSAAVLGGGLPPKTSQPTAPASRPAEPTPATVAAVLIPEAAARVERAAAAPAVSLVERAEATAAAPVETVAALTAAPAAKVVAKAAETAKPLAQAASSGAVGAVGAMEVPVLCRTCQVEYPLAFGLLSPGANLRCPHCRASHSPTQEHFLLVGHRLRRYVVELAAARSRAAGARGSGHLEKTTEQLRRSLHGDLQAIGARLLSRPKSSRLGLS